MPTIKFCPACGSKLSNAPKFCPGCGHRLSKATGQTNEQVQTGTYAKRNRVLSSKNNKSKKGLYFGSVTAIAVIGLIFYMNANPSKEEAVIEKQPKIADNINYSQERLDHAYSIAFVNNLYCQLS